MVSGCYNEGVFPFLGWKGGGGESQSLKLMPQLMMNFSRGSNGFPAVDCN